MLSRQNPNGELKQLKAFNVSDVIVIESASINLSSENKVLSAFDCQPDAISDFERGEDLCVQLLKPITGPYLPASANASRANQKKF